MEDTKLPSFPTSASTILFARFRVFETSRIASGTVQVISDAFYIGRKSTSKRRIFAGKLVNVSTGELEIAAGSSGISSRRSFTSRGDEQ